MAERLDPLTLPLQGSRLIEASAGTGKTWTIAALVLRLVLGHAGAGRPARPPLQPSQILVMTFTRAATRELSDRIRVRLARAAEVFRGDASPDPHDVLLTELLAAYPPGGTREHAAWWLASAAEAMDAAAIHTLDAWCQRVLREQEVESIAAPAREVLNDGAELRQEAAQDVWRRELYPLRGPALTLALAIWSSPQAMVDDLSRVGERPLPDAPGTDGLGIALERVAAARLADREGWAARFDTMRAWLLAEIARPQPPLSGGKVSLATVEGWHASMREWLADPSLAEPRLSDAVRRNLTASGLHAACRKGFTVDPPPVFEHYEAWLAQLATRGDPTATLRAHAARAVHARMEALKAQRGWRSHVDAQRVLADALDPQRHGERARRLRDRLRTLYPAALVDEFQDTSPLQLSILDRLYGVADDDPATALLLIGDPKQSIYGFRGADIHSYLQARRATTGRHHVLSVNHRSAHGLVDGVQALFLEAESREGSGAFGFRTPTADPLPFMPVSARGRDERFVSGGAPATPVTLCLDPADQNQEDAVHRAGERCAQVIAETLGDPSAGFADAAGQVTRVRPGDVAVLVRTAREADIIRRALQRRGLPSVFLADRLSVFATPQALEVWRLLRALAQPRDERRLRDVLAGGLLDLHWAELEALFADEQALDAEALRIAEWQRVWRSQGVLAAIRAALHGWGLPARWLQQPDGERRLTNVLHLSELLQAASTAHPGEVGLLRWLAGAIADAGNGASEEHVVRLESDADRIQVVTIHRSKGLEYPLVYLPFATTTRGRPSGRPWIAWTSADHHDPGEAPGLGFDATDMAPQGTAAHATPLAAGEGRRAVLAPSDEDLALEDADERREATRLFYVAVTRARHALWIGLSTHHVGKPGEAAWPRSAIGALLGGGPATDDVVQTLERLAGREPALACHIVRDADDPALQPPLRVPLAVADTALAEPRPYVAAIDRRWGIHSYTALLRERVGDGPLAVADPPAMAFGDAAATSLATTDTDPTGRVRSDTLKADEPWERDDPVALTADPRDDVPLFREGTAVAGDAAVGAAGEGDGRRDAGAAQDDGRASAAETSSSATSGTDAPWHGFPRGPLAGHFLHTQLEWLAGEGFALGRVEALGPLLARRCEQQGWGHRAAELLPWLTRVCQTPLPPLGASLSTLDAPLPEMEFWVPADGLDLGWLDEACTQSLLPGQPRAPLGERLLRGLLMGFADLVFEHGGRFWVLDYKSNALGTDDSAYTPSALASAVAAHRYDVQAALYLLPLHRLLRSRLGAAYEPARHLGGTIFLFLRGIASPTAGCCHLPPPLALLEALDARLPGAAMDAEAGRSPGQRRAAR